MQTVAVARNAMATRFEIVLYGQNEMALRAAGEEALDEIERLEQHLSLYRPSSEISAVNARAAISPVRVEPSVFRLLELAKRLHAETGGAFDIAIAPLVRCWGFMGGRGKMPEPNEIEEARGCVGMHLVSLDESNFTVRFERPGVMLDLGAIGKGYAVDRAVTLLREAGVESALIHGGTSTVYAIGSPPDSDLWKIGIDLPPAHASESSPIRMFANQSTEHKNQRRVFLATFSLKDESVSVSAPHGRAFTVDGEIFGHVLDPRTGRPVQSAALSAVALPSATETDALSTALLIVGTSGHSRINALRPEMRSLLVTRDEQSGELVIENVDPRSRSVTQVPEPR